MKPLTERQAEAALNHDQSLCVVAGAGTGKTHLLVQKYLDLLESRGVAVGEILALTFTEKAAAEMKGRIREAVIAKEELSEIHDDLNFAQISTFHSFCAQVLREFSIEAGINPGFTVLDDLTLKTIREDAIRELLYTEAGEEENTSLISVLRLITPGELRSHLETLDEEREFAEEFFRLLEKDEDQVLAAWQASVTAYRRQTIREYTGSRVFQAHLRTLADLARRYPGTHDPAMQYLREIESCIPDITTAPDPEISEAVFPGLIRIHQQFRAGFGQKKNWEAEDLVLVRETFRRLKTMLLEHADLLTISCLPDDPFTQATVAFQKDLGRVFQLYTGSLDAAKKRMNGLDFTDLIRYTNRLFNENDLLVEKHFRQRFRYILVDEYQDTDPIQSSIIQRIIGDTTVQSDRLFIVGDPKQSIYLFRRADVTQFADTRTLIKANLLGSEVALDRNFRSTPEVMGFVNYLFSNLMQESEKPWEFPYQLLETERREETGSITLLLADSGEDALETTRNEAELVAQKILSLVSSEAMPIYWSMDGTKLASTRPAGYGDIAILIERRTKLPIFEWALRKHGIPLTIHAGTGFYQQQEVLDVFSILSFLLNEADDLALFGALRSPFIGLSDADIFSIRELGSRYQSLFASCAAYARAYPESGCADAHRLLSQWKAAAGRLEPVDLLSLITRESGIHAVYAGIPGGEKAVANIEKILQKARGSRSNLSEFVRMINLAISGESDEAGAQIDLCSQNAVLIMTVHASKGLEFPVVVVPELNQTISYTGKSLMIADPLHLGVTLPDTGDQFRRKKTPVLTMLQDIHRRKEAAERRRLLYVATTRAKDHLILSGVVPDEPAVDLSACRSRMDWIACSLDLGEESIRKRCCMITPPGSSRQLPVALCREPGPLPSHSTITEPVPIDISSIPARILAGTPEPEAGAVIEVEQEKPRYAASRITSDAPGPRLRADPSWINARARSKGLGAAERGTILHEVFEGKTAENVLKRHGISDSAYAAELESAYAAFCRSAIIAGCREEHCEVPFSTIAYGVHFTGTIDRLVKQHDTTWVLIDYKTGGCTDKAIDSYQVQMAVYRHAAEAIIGEPVTPYLYFADSNRWILITIDEDEVERRIRRHLEREELSGKRPHLI
ncbi:MAG: DNA helicase UvrD [Methanocalculus sp. MSAO_Arc1]|uniref:UvrD-helicase domain-containing protein n=1 Tax=Methanocalculus TaxID=71151 RepID=UPI000FEE2348|nr:MULTISPECIES: UvrD-helicase domain-containing protein [unclassified Methanocalculus]MCP1662278.1 ATP-dependent helicase/nuclease subunit A [Methanocalculus sp. AMF5]RQD81726.1 MAG: DNA helicase UvrD [Methanocalculus sp. MSAO_Arc1]